MSEQRQYPLSVQVEVIGYDTARYALLQADTQLWFQVESDGFIALSHSLTDPTPKVCVDITGHKELYCAVAVADLNEVFHEQLGYGSTVDLSPTKDSLRFYLTERSHKTFHPSIGQVRFSFAEQYGLYGNMEMVPQEVTLYGPEEELNKIKELPVEATVITDIKGTNTYELPLQPVWEQLNDVHPSATKVRIMLPVTKYIEHEYKVPVKVAGADTSLRFRIYPEEVVLRVWVAQHDVQHIVSSQFEVSIDYNDVLSNKEHLKVRLDRFPTAIRPRSVEPQTVQCVIIK